MAFAFRGPLYPIANAGGRHSAVDLVAAAVGAGIRVVQLRVKSGSTRSFVELARAAKTITDRNRALLIIDDRTDIARLIDAAGVHLGTEDLPAAAARVILGPTKIIGLSTHSPAQLAAAEREGYGDYLAYGPIFPTYTKERPDPVQGLDGLRAARQLTKRPLVAIGGVNATNVEAVLKTGVDAVAIISAFADADDPAAAVQTLHQKALAATVHRSPSRS